jgi:hypothetical protein
MDGKTYEEIIEVEGIRSKQTLKELEISPNHELFKRILKSKKQSISTDETLNYITTDNVSAVHPNNTYTFHRGLVREECEIGIFALRLRGSSYTELITKSDHCLHD